MRIAQIAPLYESVPPRFYGGTERIVHYLTEELVKKGHDVTLFASGDSQTSAHLVASSPHALRLTGCQDPNAHHILMLERFCQQSEAESFDIAHFHIDFFHLPMMRRLQTPSVTTLHGRLDSPDIKPLYQEFCEAPLVSISASQRQPLSFCNWQGTVYHGLPSDLYSFVEKPEDYLAFVGRISPEKRLDRAIAIAKQVGLKLRIAAKIDPADENYFHTEIKPLLSHPLIDFVGEVDDKSKQKLIGNARALMFPINWPEPFGLVMIEAMAMGTPVIAFRQGSVPEVIDDGLSGFIVRSIEEGAAAVHNISHLNRRWVRRTFDKRFSASRMADDYLAIYQRIIAQKNHSRPLLHQQQKPLRGGWVHG